MSRARTGITPLADKAPCKDCPSRTIFVASATAPRDRKSTRLNSSHTVISYAVFCLKKKTPLLHQYNALPTRPLGADGALLHHDPQHGPCGHPDPRLPLHAQCRLTYHTHDARPRPLA